MTKFFMGIHLADNNLAVTQSNSQKPSLANEEFSQVFALWSKYEEIAMHFNDLLIKLRVQALGGIAIIGTVATAFLKESHGDLTKYLLPLSFLLSVGWLALYYLDVYYYNCLLSGAIKTIKQLEKGNLSIQLSTNIVDEVGSYKVFGKFSGRKMFYMLIFFMLLLDDLYYLLLSLGYTLNPVFVFAPVFIFLLFPIRSFFSLEPNSDDSNSELVATGCAQK